MIIIIIIKKGKKKYWIAGKRLERNLSVIGNETVAVIIAHYDAREQDS